MAIFVNYRREDSASVAMLVYERLCREFGKGFIYLDLTDIPIGADFVEHLSHEVSKCEAMLVVIGKAWLSTRLYEENDFVRIEIEAAIDRKIPIIPLLVEGACMPDAEKLPSSIRSLVRLQAVRIDSDSRFNYEIDMLIQGIYDVLKQPVRKSVYSSTWERLFARLKRLRFQVKLSTVLGACLLASGVVVTARILFYETDSIRAEENVLVKKNSLVDSIKKTMPHELQSSGGQEIDTSRETASEQAKTSERESHAKFQQDSDSRIRSADSASRLGSKKPADLILNASATASSENNVAPEKNQAQYIVNSSLNELDGKSVYLNSEQQLAGTVMEMLRPISAKMNLKPKRKLNLVVRTSYLSNMTENEIEAKKIVEIIRQSLISNFHISPNRINAKGIGEKKNISTSASDEERQRAGRIDFLFQNAVSKMNSRVEKKNKGVVSSDTQPQYIQPTGDI